MSRVAAGVSNSSTVLPVSPQFPIISDVLGKFSLSNHGSQRLIVSVSGSVWAYDFAPPGPVAALHSSS